MDLEGFMRRFQAGGAAGGGPPPQDVPLPDSSEVVQISSLALLKMLKHGRSGVPLEVMGLMLGEFVDEFTIQVVDVFAMPQNGSAVSVEAVDPAYQAEMLDMLKPVHRPQMVVGWYHSHPGMGCWLSNVDINTQTSFEQLHKRCIGVVVDPIQSVKGKVVIDAFRNINQQTMLLQQAPRQTTSNLGHLRKPTIQQLIHNLNRYYYSLNIDYRKTELETKMLVNLHKHIWSEGLKVTKFDQHHDNNEKTVKKLLSLAKQYNKRLEEEEGKTPEELVVMGAGRLDPKRHLQREVEDSLSANINQTLGMMLGTVLF